MAKLCPQCDKEFSKGKICPICNTHLVEKAEKPVQIKRRCWHWYDAGIIIAAAIAIYLILTKVTVGYVEEEKYTVQGRYEENEYYNVTEPYTVQVPYTITQYIMDYESYVPEKVVTKETCYYKDIPYIVNYVPGLQNPYKPATETGYRFNNAGVYGEYVQKVEVCRSPIREQNKESGFDAEFAICNYVGDKRVECPDRLITKYGDLAAGYYKQGSLEDKNYAGVYSTNNNLICFRKITLVWKTPYDVRKSIRLEAIKLPQIRVCDKEEVKEKVNLYTESGQIKQLPVRPVEREISKTLYKEETRLKEVTKTRKIEKFNDVPKIRYIQKERSLWEELRLQYGF